MLDHELSSVIHRERERAIHASLRDRAHLAGRCRRASVSLGARILALVTGRPRPTRAPGRSQAPGRPATTPPAV